MAKIWTHNARNGFMIVNLLYMTCCTIVRTTCAAKTDVFIEENMLDKRLKNYVDRILSVDEYDIVPGVQIEPIHQNYSETAASTRTLFSLPDYVQQKVDHYLKTHTVSVNLPQTARFFAGAETTGKSSFLTGFGMGFLAFALKKLLLPVFIGAQLVKSVLIAMFLPSILGSLGKLVGKGLSTFSGVSGASTGINGNQHVEDFEFKDTAPYNANEDLADFHADTETGASSSSDTSTLSPNSRFGIGNNRIAYVSPNSDTSYYMRRPQKKTDYKVFHKIPSSSMLLTSYDPFYSPLLSRLDAVFQQLGLGNDKSPETERCREQLVCLMYANPAKYAPYSNLVSAQLSRELNELRRPASDNPEILRFFRYMKAAKDGQDGEECLAHGQCATLAETNPSPAMLTTFNDINKLVQARKLN